MSNEFRTITLTDEQLAIVLEALTVRLQMGRFELDELRRHFQGVANDAVIYTEQRVRELSETLDALKKQ